MGIYTMQVYEKNLSFYFPKTYLKVNAGQIDNVEKKSHHIFLMTC